jgi:hypothetical protein
MRDDLEADLAAGDPTAINLVKETRAELNSAREAIGRLYS